MATEKFEVGEKEKRYVTVELDLTKRRVKIEQDGVIVAKKFLISPTAKKFEFDIGNSERHHVEITAGLFHSIELNVDGEKAHPLL